MLQIAPHEDQAAGAALAFGGGDAGLGAPDLAFEGFFPEALSFQKLRGHDGIERSAEQWFKRYNAKAPKKGGGAEVAGGQGRGLAGEDPQGVGADGEPGA